MPENYFPQVNQVKGLPDTNGHCNKSLSHGLVGIHPCFLLEVAMGKYVGGPATHTGTPEVLMESLVSGELSIANQSELETIHRIPAIARLHMVLSDLVQLM